MTRIALCILARSGSAFPSTGHRHSLGLLKQKPLVPQDTHFQNPWITFFHNSLVHSLASRRNTNANLGLVVIYTLTILIKAVIVRRSPASHRAAKIWTGTVRDVFDPAHVHLTSAMPSPMANDTFMIEHDADPFHREPMSASIRLSTVVNVDREVRCAEEYIRAPPVAYGSRLFV